MKDRGVNAGSQGRPGAFLARCALLLLTAFAFDCSHALASERVVSLEITDSHVTYDLGERQRGERFTLHLKVHPAQAGQAPAPALHLLEAEPTCDCAVTSIADTLLIVDFHVEPEEPDGPIEKVIYLFTANPAHDLIRLLLKATVLPGPGVSQPASNAESIPSSDMQQDRAEDGFAERKGEPLVVLYFHSPGCQSCRRVHDYTLPYLRETFGDAIIIHEVDIDSPDGFARLLMVRERYNVTDRSSPFLFVLADQAISGERQLAARLTEAIEQSLSANLQTWLPPEATEGDTQKRARSLFRSLTFWAVVGAGLLDGINPCAFATLVFFIGLLHYTGSTRRQMLLVGVGFTVTVFTVYLLLGLGAFRALQALAVYGIIARSIYLLTLLLLLVLIFLSLRDLVHYWRTGDTSKAALQLTTKNKQRIHRVMRRGLRNRNLLLGAIGIGAVVTLFEAACTGQVYLPTIVLMLRDPHLQSHALGYLVLYNFLFVLPLVLVFSLSYSGVASQKFATWSRRHYGATRLLLTLLFLALALLMAWELLHV